MVREVVGFVMEAFEDVGCSVVGRVSSDAGTGSVLVGVFIIALGWEEV